MLWPRKCNLTFAPRPVLNASMIDRDEGALKIDLMPDKAIELRQMLQDQGHGRGQGAPGRHEITRPGQPSMMPAWNYWRKKSN